LLPSRFSVIFRDGQFEPAPADGGCLRRGCGHGHDPVRSNRPEKLHQGRGIFERQGDHSIQRPVGPMEESLLAKLAATRLSNGFSGDDRRLSLGNEEVVRVLGIDPFLDRSIRPELSKVEFSGDETDNAEPLLSFLVDEKAVLIDHGLNVNMESLPVM